MLGVRVNMGCIVSVTILIDTTSQLVHSFDVRQAVWSRIRLSVRVRVRVRVRIMG